MTDILQGEWKKVLMVNYEVDPKILQPFLPHHTVLDKWNNTCYISLVGYMFNNARIRGFKIPFHSNFEQVNLRFYVCYKSDGKWRDGIVFIREIMPKPFFVLAAKTIYKERYMVMPMFHRWDKDNYQQLVEYRWGNKNNWNSLKAHAGLESYVMPDNSEEQYYIDRHWGYTRIDGEKTAEYAVVHPQWNLYTVINYEVNVDFGNVYGERFRFLSNTNPKSVFLAEGSEIKVKDRRFLS